MSAKSNIIGVVGTGVIGASWAAFYASHGCHVRLFDSDIEGLESGRQSALQHLQALRDFGILSSEDHEQAPNRIVVAESLHDAVRDAWLVQESVSEDYGVKQEVFRQVDRAASPETILASSSSGLLMTKLQSVMDYPARSLIAHPFNPPHLIPLVELVSGRKTDPRTISRMKSFFESLGKVPVVLQKEVPGHIANRLQAAVWREAIQLVIDGVASVADVDKAMTAGPGIRWALLGPNTIFHLGGGSNGIGHFIEHIGSGWNELWDDMASWRSLPPKTQEVLVNGLTEATGGRSSQEVAAWRDAKIAKILQALRDAPSD